MSSLRQLALERLLDVATLLRDSAGRPKEGKEVLVLALRLHLHGILAELELANVTLRSEVRPAEDLLVKLRGMQLVDREFFQLGRAVVKAEWPQGIKDKVRKLDAFIRADLNRTAVDRRAMMSGRRKPGVD